MAGGDKTAVELISRLHQQLELQQFVRGSVRCFNHVQGYIQRLGGVLRGLHGIVGHPGKMHQCGLYGKALLLQNAHSNGSVHAAVQPNKNLILLFKCIKTQCSVHNILLYQRCAVRQACFPPYFLLCSTAKRSQRSFSGWPAWPFSQW